MDGESKPTRSTRTAVLQINFEREKVHSKLYGIGGKGEITSMHSDKIKNDWFLGQHDQW